VVSSGQVLSLSIEKPAAGGPMIARADGQVVLVSGAIPGERVTARIERVGKGVAYAHAIAIEEPSADRRDPFADPLCGGCGYSHIAYDRQLAIKGQVVADAFARIGRLSLAAEVRVAASREEGYRMRARFHLHDGVAGFFREGTHEVCDARISRQILTATADAVDTLAERLRTRRVAGITDLEVSENIDASERAVHLTTSGQAGINELGALRGVDGVTGLSFDVNAGQRTETLEGAPYVTDTVAIDGQRVVLRRHVLAFFQANRFLFRDLVEHVSSRIERSSVVIDLYAGVGVFAVSAAVGRGARVTAVEGDRIAARDLDVNQAQAGGSVETVHQPVEAFTEQTSMRPHTLIVDPPRTGMSKAALSGAINLRARRILYVSCDVATLARDARRLADAGYALTQIDGFDLFPNTPHVETVAEFENLRA
jgi:23S rRNA (uracil1939-C5)-methyltransferase